MPLSLPRLATLATAVLLPLAPLQAHDGHDHPDLIVTSRPGQNSAPVQAAPVQTAPVQAAPAKKAPQYSWDVVWRGKKGFMLNGVGYYIAVAPDKSFALGGWKPSDKGLNLNDMERAASHASGCRARLAENYSHLTQGGRMIPKSAAPGHIRMKIALSC